MFWGFFSIFYRLAFLNGNDRKKLIPYMGKCKPILVKSIEICLNMFNLICSDIYTSVKNQVVNIKIWQTSYTWVVRELLRQYKYLIFKATNFSRNWHQNCRKLKKMYLIKIIWKKNINSFKTVHKQVNGPYA